MSKNIGKCSKERIKLNKEHEKYYTMMSQAFYALLESISTEMRYNRILKKWKNREYTPIDIELPGKEYEWQYMGLFECYFHIKEIPNWKFGVWLLPSKKECDCYEVVGEADVIRGTWFCAYEKNIDKFKPSRCTFSGDFYVPVNAKEPLCYPEHYPCSLIENAIYFIKHNRYVAIYEDCDSATPYIYVSKTKAFLSYCDRFLHDLWKSTTTKVLDRLILNIYKKYNFYGLKSAYIHENEKNFSPRYEMRCPIEGNEEIFESTGYAWWEDDFYSHFDKKLNKVYFLAKLLGRKYYSKPIDEHILVYDKNNDNKGE